MSYILVSGGFMALLIGGDRLVAGAVALAQRYGVSPMVIGLTLVGFGTSMPEMVTSVQAARVGAPGIALGNAVGSNICNILLILGLAALVRPVMVNKGVMRRDGTILLAVSAIAVALALNGVIGRGAGMVLVLGLGAFLWLAFRTDAGDEDALPAVAMPQWRAIAEVVVGLVITLLGAKLLITGAVDVAQGLRVSEAVIGVTVVAVGTSLPELVTSVQAARRGQSEVALGNIVGSNIFNILGILGVTTLIQPLPVDPEILGLDIWVMMAAAVALVGVALTGGRISRGDGAVLLGGYGAYLGWVVATL